MKQNFFILSAYPGHGKDFCLSLLKDITGNDFNQIQLALKAKEIIAESLSKKYIEGNENDKISVLNDLKDKKMDVNVVSDVNMRGLLQIILGDVFRNINSNINTLFTLKKLEEDLINNKVNFICTDNRYKNEQEFLYPLTFLISNEEKIDYIRWRILENLTKYSQIEILDIFENLTKKINKNSEDSIMLNKIKMNFIKMNEKLNTTLDYKKDYSAFVSSINFKDIGNMSKEEGLKHGLIHIFRPIIPINYIDNGEDIKEVIKRYTLMKNEEILFIENNYNRYKIDFNVNNIHKYGFLRADPTHLSERDLDGRKPAPFFNIPFHLERNLKEELSECLIEEKKNNNKIKKIKHT